MPQHKPFATAASDSRIERRFRLGYDAFASGDMRQAADHFAAILKRDPTCADAILGLHALGDRWPGQLAELARNADAVGRYQTLTGRPLRSAYIPGDFCSAPLRTADDARAAYAAELAGRGLLDLAAEQLSRCAPGDPSVAMVKARVAFAQGRYQDASAYCQSATSLPVIAFDVRLLSGRVLLALDRADSAVAVLSALLDDPLSKRAALHVRYYLALALHQSGDTASALSLLQGIHAEDPLFADVAVRLGFVPQMSPAVEGPSVTEDVSVEPTHGWSTAPAEGTDDVWDSLVAAFEFGEPAPEPELD